MGTLDQSYRALAIGFVPIALARFSDDFVVRQQEMPAPLSGWILEHYILHNATAYGLAHRASI